jgi:glycosyltransferase involved in cell wall biosynthesis
MRRVIYVGPYSTDELNEKFGSAAQTGAIRNKMLGVARAMKLVGYDASIVTALPSTKNKNQFFQMHNDGVAIYVVTVRAGPLFRLIAMLKYVLVIIRQTSRSDIVVFYNYFPEYIFAALFLRLSRRSYILDIEDGPYFDTLSFRGIVTQSSFKIHQAIGPSGYFSVSHQLVQRLNLQKCLVIYGVSTSPKSTELNKMQRRIEDTFVVLYGGTLIKDTGLEMFLECLSILAQRSSGSFEFILTGYYDKNRIEDFLKSANIPENISVQLKPRLRVDEYREILNRSGAALNLRMADSALGQTTFPSKLIEYGDLNIPIISTRCENVEEVLNERTCFFLDEASPAGLAEQLLKVRNNPDLARQKAEDAHRHIMMTTCAESIGKKIAGHFDENL